ncbi:MAG: hypothetical protein RLT05_20650 [Bauldia litoralis]
MRLALNVGGNVANLSALDDGGVSFDDWAAAENEDANSERS